MHPISQVLTFRNLFIFFFFILVLGGFLGFLVCQRTYLSERENWQSQFIQMDSLNTVLQKRAHFLNESLHKSDSIHAISLQESRLHLEDLTNKKRIVSKDIDSLLQRVHVQDSLRKVILIDLLKSAGNNL